ncbi:MULTISPECIES: hypothetical protein [Moorena]|uniref:Uncharacterized protein n=1 Tax=Moorena producens (strain JHB) TaxID=1454205 RepID=A0A9Q9UVP0_MOOP1|nr:MULTISPECIES: hypothetical protein [Moorena]NES44375.1 hypothetical protein [Moorena sp. SIO2C4]WAN69036.1 hypothetical protein BJP36_42540 [Moorena producens JHB]
MGKSLRLVVRYGADYPNPGYEANNKGKSAPNSPYALTLAYWPRDRVQPWPLATRSRSTFNLLTFNLLPTPSPNLKLP